MKDLQTKVCQNLFIFSFSLFCHKHDVIQGFCADGWIKIFLW